MGCASSKNAGDENDPPFEKPVVNQTQQSGAPPPKKIPEIQINGPSSSPKKEIAAPAAAVNGHGPPRSLPPVKEPPPPLFPFITPEKYTPGFDLRKDVTLSPQPKRHEGEEDGELRNDLNDTMSSTQSNSLENTPDREESKELGRYDEGVEEGDKTEEQAARVDQVNLQEKEQDKARPAVAQVAAGEEEDEAEDDKPSQAQAPPAESTAPKEDRSAILARFLEKHDMNTGPTVADDDDESANFPVYVRAKDDPEVLANQVEDDEMEQSEAPPPALLKDQSNSVSNAGDNQDSGAAVSALKKAQTDDGDFAPLDPEDKRKLNEFLNQIEAVAETLSPKESETIN